MAEAHVLSPLTTQLVSNRNIAKERPSGYSTQAMTNGSLWVKAEALFLCTSEVCIQLGFPATLERIKLCPETQSYFPLLRLSHAPFPSTLQFSQDFQSQAKSTASNPQPSLHGVLNPASQLWLAPVALLSAGHRAPPETGCMAWVSKYSVPRTLYFISPHRAATPQPETRWHPGQTARTN